MRQKAVLIPVVRETSFVSRDSRVVASDETRFTIHASRVSKTPQADFLRILLEVHDPEQPQQQNQAQRDTQ